MPENFCPPDRKGAFSLVELLAVLAVMAVVSAASVPAVSALTKSSGVNRAMAQISGLLEQARQYAVANNTYTWVVFEEDAHPVEGSTLRVAVLSSRNGTDPTEGFSVEGSVPGEKVVLLVKSTSFPKVVLKEAGANTWASLPDASPLSDVAQGVRFTVPVPGKGEMNFDRVVQFGPSGEAKVSSGIPNVIELGLRPLQGGVIEDTQNIAVIRITGMTGQTRLFRP